MAVCGSEYTVVRTGTDLLVFSCVCVISNSSGFVSNRFRKLSQHGPYTRHSRGLSPRNLLFPSRGDLQTDR